MVGYFYLLVYLDDILVTFSSHSSCNPPNICGYVEYPFIEKLSRDNSYYVVIAFTCCNKYFLCFCFSFYILSWVEMMLQFLSYALIALNLIFVIFCFVFMIFQIRGVFQLSVPKHNEIGSKTLLHQQRHRCIQSALFFSLGTAHSAKLWFRKKQNMQD